MANLRDMGQLSVVIQIEQLTGRGRNSTYEQLLSISRAHGDAGQRLVSKVRVPNVPISRDDDSVHFGRRVGLRYAVLVAREHIVVVRLDLQRVQTGRGQFRSVTARRLFDVLAALGDVGNVVLPSVARFEKVSALGNASFVFQQVILASGDFRQMFLFNKSFFEAINGVWSGRGSFGKSGLVTDR